MGVQGLGLEDLGFRNLRHAFRNMAIQTLDLNPRRVALPGWSLLKVKVKEQDNGEQALTLVYGTPAAPVTPLTAGCLQAQHVSCQWHGG